MKQYKGVFLVAISAIVFGLMPVAAKIAYEGGSNPIMLTLARFLFGSLFLILITVYHRKEKIALTCGSYSRVFLISIGYALTPPLLFFAYQYISTGMTTTLHFVYPIIVIVLCALMFRQRITKIQLICCVMCMLGVVAFSGFDSKVNLIGVASALLSGVTFALYIIPFSRFDTGAISSYKFSFYMCSFGALILLVIGLFTQSLTLHLTPAAWAASLILSFGTSVIATVCFQAGIQLIGPQKASLLSTFEPLTSVIVGALFFGEKLTSLSLVGIVLILVSVLLLTVEKKPSIS